MRIIARMNVGGPAVQISGLMRNLDENYFEHKLYTGYCQDGETDYLEISAKDVKAIRIRGLGRSVSLFSDFQALIRLVIEIRKFRPDIIHTHTAKAGTLGRVASRISGRESKIVHTFHGHLLYGNFSKISTFLIISIEKFLANRSDKILAVGGQVRDELMAAGIGTIDKYVVMPPGLELREIWVQNDARKFLGLDDNVFYCGFIARITQVKRPDRLLDVAREIDKRKLKIIFLVAGEGDLLNEIKSQSIKENLPIKFLGWREDIEVVLGAIDMALLTSDNEGMPLSLIQAGMAGKPVVSTNVGAVSEVIVEGETGYISGFEPIEIADLIEKLYSDASKSLEMGELATERNLKKFGIKRLVEDHQKLYRELVIEFIK